MTKRERKLHQPGPDWEDHLEVDPGGAGCGLTLAFAPLLVANLLTWERRTDGRWTSPTLTLWHDGTYWRASLHDRARHMVSWASAEDLDALINYFEQGLRRGTLQWSPDEKP